MPIDKVLSFLTANAGLTKIVELEAKPEPYKYVPLPVKIRQVETFTIQGKQVWLFTYTNGTWERIEDSTLAMVKSLELFPPGPPPNN